MYMKKTHAIAGTAVTAALSVVLMLVGSFASATIFFTAAAAYLTGYSVGRYGLRYGCAQLAVCMFLDLFLNPDKIHVILYFCMGVYILLCEWVFARWNRAEEGKKKMRVQLICNWAIFQVIFVPALIGMHHILPAGNIPGGTPVLWLAGQAGWLLFDKSYRVFLGMIRNRKL